MRARPKAEMQWYKGNHKIKEGTKFTSKYIELGSWEFEVLLEISVRLLVVQISLNNYTYTQYLL